MPTQAEARESVYDLFRTTWGSRTPYTLENELFHGDSQSTAWVRVSVRFIDPTNATLGPIGQRKYRRSGIAFFQIFTLLDKGMAAADGHAVVVRNGFEGVTYESVNFFDATARDLGPDGKWNMTTVEVNFNFEEVR